MYMWKYRLQFFRTFTILRLETEPILVGTEMGQRFYYTIRQLINLGYVLWLHQSIPTSAIRWRNGGFDNLYLETFFDEGKAITIKQSSRIHIWPIRCKTPILIQQQEVFAMLCLYYKLIYILSLFVNLNECIEVIEPIRSIFKWE